MKKKRKKARTGRTVAFLLAGYLAVAGCTGLVWAAGKKNKKPAAGAAETVSPAILGGTVFSGSGFALPGAEVLIARTEPPPGKERWKAVSDARGEFIVRLPPGPAKYNVSVRARGLKPQEKAIEFTADERLDLNFLLEPGTGSGK